MNNSADVEFIVAWHAVKDCDWQAPKGLSRNWLRNLPAGLRVKIPDVIDLLAFGATMQPDGRTKGDAWGARILAARRLFSAAALGAIIIYGQRAELLNNGALGALPLKCLGLYRHIAAQEFANNALTLSPFNPKWLSPAFIASDRELWGKREAVSYIDLTGDRDLLGKWFGELSGTVSTGRPKGTGYRRRDESLVAEVVKMIDDGIADSCTEATTNVIGRDGSGAAGVGTAESKIKRIARKARLILDAKVQGEIAKAEAVTGRKRE